MLQSNWRFRLFFASLVMFALSGYYSYVEMAYLFQSRPARATITGVSEVTTRRRSSTTKHLRIDYAFAESNGTRRTGSDDRPLGWRPDADGGIQIQYTPGELGRSRIAGNVNTWMLILFACSFGVLAVFAVLLFLEARAATRPREPVRKRRKTRREDW